MSTYVGEYYNYKSGMVPDHILKSVNLRYSDGTYGSGQISINSSDRYYTKATWNGIPALPNDYSGLVATNNSGAC